MSYFIDEKTVQKYKCLVQVTGKLELENVPFIDNRNVFPS